MVLDFYSDVYYFLNYSNLSNKNNSTTIRNCITNAFRYLNLPI